MSAPLVRLERITRRFGTLIANRDVSLTLAPGEIHALVGENHRLDLGPGGRGGVPLHRARLVASPEEDGGRGQTCEQEDSDENQTWRPEISHHKGSGDHKSDIRHCAHHGHRQF